MSGLVTSQKLGGARPHSLSIGTIGNDAVEPYRRDMSRLERIAWAALAVTIAFPLLLLFDHFGKLELGRLVDFALMLFLAIVKVCWDYRRRPLFWISIIVFASLHAALFIYAPSRLERMPFQALLGFAYLDTTLIIISTERVLGEKTTFEKSLSGRIDLDEGWLSTAQQSEKKISTETRPEILQGPE